MLSFATGVADPQGHETRCHPLSRGPSAHGLDPWGKSGPTHPPLVLPRGDRGRENRLGSIPPPSEPDVRISRIRLSSRWFYLQEDWQAWAWASRKLKSPC